MVIGGGIIRDAIMGGVPVDIDVWLPSNINLGRSIRAFHDIIYQNFLVPVTHVFEGPQELNPDNDPNNYRDMSNHWVVEFNVGTVKFNVMRTMTEWTGDAQAFFASVMQNFDIDLCMMFTGAIPTGRGFFAHPVTNIVLPSNIVENLQEGRAIDTFCWNRFRYEQTNVARRNFRRNKIISRYGVQEGVVIERAQFIPTPVELSFVLEAQSLLPFPQPPEMADLRTTREAEAQGFGPQDGPAAPGDGGWGETPTERRLAEIDRRIEEFRVRQLGLDRNGPIFEMYQNMINNLARERGELRTRRTLNEARTGRSHGRGAVPPINIPAAWMQATLTDAQEAAFIAIAERQQRDRDLAAAQLQRQQEDQWRALTQGQITPDEYRHRVTNNFFAQPAGAADTPWTAEALAGLVQRARAGQDTAQRATLNGNLNGAAIHDEVWVDEAIETALVADLLDHEDPMVREAQENMLRGN